jgi:hypothetical protein
VSQQHQTYSLAAGPGRAWSFCGTPYVTDRMRVQGITTHGKQLQMIQHAQEPATVYHAWHALSLQLRSFSYDFAVYC